MTATFAPSQLAVGPRLAASAAKEASFIPPDAAAASGPRGAPAERIALAAAPDPVALTAKQELTVAVSDAGSLVAQISVHRLADGSFDIRIEPANLAAGAQLRTNLPELRRQLSAKFGGLARVRIDEADGPLEVLPNSPPPPA